MQPVLIGVIVTLGLQLIGAVWGAARLHTSVSEMRIDIQQLRDEVQRWAAISQKLDTRVSVLEDRDTREPVR